MSSRPYGVYLTYDAERHQDGLGAQTQRLMGVYAASKRLKIGYYHSDILSLDPNPGETRNVVRELISFANRVFDMGERDLDNFDWHIAIKSLDKKSRLFIYCLNTIALWLGLRVSCKVAYPYAITDVSPDLYELPARQIRKNFQNLNINGVFRIDMHIRRSVVPKVDGTGIRYFRFLEDDWYVRVLRSIVGFLDARSREYLIRIHTDEISKPWTLPSDLSTGTRELWTKLGVVNEQGLLQPSIEPVDKAFSHFQNVEVARGWNPARALDSMVSANILVTYPSSFSYVAGLIRSRDPVISPKFWHNSPTWWLTLPQEFHQDSETAIHSYLNLKCAETESK